MMVTDWKGQLLCFLLVAFYVCIMIIIQRAKDQDIPGYVIWGARILTTAAVGWAMWMLCGGGGGSLLAPL